jgi:hypothetical protein
MASKALEKAEHAAHDQQGAPVAKRTLDPRLIGFLAALQ